MVDFEKKKKKKRKELMTINLCNQIHLANVYPIENRAQQYYKESGLPWPTLCPLVYSTDQTTLDRFLDISDYIFYEVLIITHLPKIYGLL